MRGSQRGGAHGPVGQYFSAHTSDKLNQRHQRWQSLPRPEDLSDHSHYLPPAAGAILNYINELKTEHHTSRLIYPGSLSFGWENKTDIRSGSVVDHRAEGPIPFLRHSVGGRWVRWRPTR